MALKSSLAAALVALGGAGVAVVESYERAGTTSGLSNPVPSSGVTVVKTDRGGYGIELS